MRVSLLIPFPINACSSESAEARIFEEPLDPGGFELVFAWIVVSVATGMGVCLPGLLGEELSLAGVVG